MYKCSIGYVTPSDKFICMQKAIHEVQTMLNAQIVSLSIELFLIRHVQRAVCSAESCVRYNVCIR